MIIQFSRGGGQFMAGKAANNDNDAACIAGASRGRQARARSPSCTACPSSSTRTTASARGCRGSTASWRRTRTTSRRTASRSSRRTCSTSRRSRSRRTSPPASSTSSAWPRSTCMLEMELGVTGGEEDGVDNSDVDESKLYTQPEEVWDGERRALRARLYKALSSSRVPNGMFTVEGRRLRQRARRVRAGQRAAHAADPARHAVVHQGEARLRHRQARQVRLPRRLGLVARGHPDTQWAFYAIEAGHDQDEHRHRRAVGAERTPRCSYKLSASTKRGRERRRLPRPRLPVAGVGARGAFRSDPDSRAAARAENSRRPARPRVGLTR